MLKDVIIEVDRAAKALDMHDVDTAALCLRKAVEGHVEMQPPEPSPDPHATNSHAELVKAVNALETKDCSLAALCLEKAVDRIARRRPAETVTHFRRLVDAVKSENLSSMATSLRDGVKTLIGDRVVEPVAIPKA